MEIFRIGQDKTIKFAYDELLKYLKMASEKMMIKEGIATGFREDENKLWVGMSDEFSTLLPKVENTEVDDAIYINVKNGKGIITGNNPRSVLIAVYRFLKELGFAWVRPGKEGEIVPEALPAEYEINICEAASYRHRAVCIEGAVSVEHVRNVIDWIPKASMNSYFIQFRLPYAFFDRWYSHKRNPLLEGETISCEDAGDIQRLLEEDISARGLLYHAVGHSWTCEPFGIRGLSWDDRNSPVPEGVSEMFALVDGKRELWGGVALNTNLCYSNPKVIETMSDAIVKYCIENPGVSYLHVWLADGKNNNCECEECSKKRPSDYYVMLLNEIDKKLTEAKIDTKIVFLLYVDLLWGPLEERIKNKDRFIMMFAPISRSYTRSFYSFAKEGRGEMAPYVRNKLEMPSKVADNLEYLRSWQEIFDGDCVDFDYHLMWDHFIDPGNYACARLLHEDVQNLDKIGLDGYISCQTHRATYPTGLPMTMMAKGLWDKECVFEEEADKYFRIAFGKDGEKVRDYLKLLSEKFVPPFMRKEMREVPEELKEGVREIKGIIADFYPTIEENVKNNKGSVKRSWEYLVHHAEISARYSDVVLALMCQDKEKAGLMFDKVEEYLWKNEPELHSIIDMFHYTRHIRETVIGKWNTASFSI